MRRDGVLRHLPARGRLRPGLLACLAAALLPLVVACAVVAPSATTVGPDGSRVPPATALATGATVAPTTAATRVVRPSASPSAPPDLPATPPAASLSAEGGDPVLGQLGSFTWGGSGSDSPWLPGAPITVGAREPLVITFADGPPVSRWTARRTTAGATSPVGAVPAGSGAGPIGIEAPPSGSWTLAVSVEFAGNGSATWYWRLDVR